MSVITDVAALYDDKGKPSRVLQTCVTHFKDRFREIMKRAGAPVSSKTKSTSSTDDRGSLLVLEASFPAEDAEAAAQALSSAQARLFTPTMKGAGLINAGLTPVTKLFPLKVVGAVGLEVSVAAGQVNVKAGLAVLHPEAKLVEKELAVKTVAPIPVKPAPVKPVDDRGYFVVGISSRDWANPVEGVDNLTVSGPLLAMTLRLTPLRVGRAGHQIVVLPPASAMDNLTKAYPDRKVPVDVLEALLVTPLVKALKPVFKGWDQVQSFVYGNNSFGLTRAVGPAKTYKLAWMPNTDFRYDKNIARKATATADLNIRPVSVEEYKLVFDAKGRAKLTQTEAVAKVRWDTYKGDGDMVGDDVTDLIPFFQDYAFQVYGAPPKALVDVKARKILWDRLPERFAALRKDSDFLKGQLDDMGLVKRCEELSESFALEQAAADEARSQKALGMTIDQITRILDEECPLYDVVYEGDNTWAAEPPFGRSKEGYDEYSMEFQDWAEELRADLKHHFGSALQWSIGDKGWVQLYMR